MGTTRFPAASPGSADAADAAERPKISSALRIMAPTQRMQMLGHICGSGVSFMRPATHGFHRFTTRSTKTGWKVERSEAGDSHTQVH